MPNKRIGLRLNYLPLVGLILSISCSCIRQTQSVESFYLTPVPLETVFAFRATYPIEEARQAAMVARQELGSSPHFKPIGGQIVLSAERLRLADAHKRVEQPGSTSYEDRSPDTPVWLIVFRGYWQISPPDPLHTITPFPPSLSCNYVLLDVSEPGPLELGGIACPPDLPPWVEITSTPVPTRQILLTPYP